MKKINWLASYPKSGNTWVRVFLANYRAEAGKQMGINDLPGFPAVSRWVFDLESGLESSLLTREETTLLRPSLYEWLASRAEENYFIKIHDPLVEVASDIPVTSAQQSAKALYVARNPLDVAVSIADFLAITIDSAIDLMARKEWSYNSPPAEIDSLLYCPWVDWSFHVESWLGSRWFPVQAVRYEDLKADPHRFFGEVIRFLELPFDEERLKRAIAYSDFRELKRQEQETPFRERSPFAKSFFRKGVAGGWKEVLTKEQVKRIVDAHGEVIEHFGYLDEM